MYMDGVKSSGHSDLKGKITFTYKNHLLQFTLAALNSRILNEITNILHVIVHLRALFVHMMGPTHNT